MMVAGRGGIALEPARTRILENVLRGLSTATRSLRLYPPTSPIPRQTVDSAVEALNEWFAQSPGGLQLSVAREGFAFEGESVASKIVVSLEFADTLRDHGVAQIDITPGVTADDLLGFLSLVSRSPDELRAEGGIDVMLADQGVQSIRLTDIQLVAIEASLADSADDEMLLRDIADNPAKLGSWFANASSLEREAFRSSLDEFIEVAGDQGTDNLASALSDSLTSQPAENRDALLTLALEDGPARELTQRMFSSMAPEDIAMTILDGKFGRNMLSLSSALANLPFDKVQDSVRQQVIDMLPGAGHTPSEAAFLDHMLEVRTSDAEEPALAEVDRSYETIVQAGSVPDTDIGRARNATASATTVLDTVGVRTMFTLLDTHTDYERFCAGVDAIAAMVPRLLDRGEYVLAAQILGELASRESLHPEWLDLSSHLVSVLESAVSPESAARLLHACVEDRSLIPAARQLLRLSGDSVYASVAAESISLKTEGVKVAEELIGMRLVDLLHVLAPQAQWFQLGPIVERLAREGGPRSINTIEAMLARPEEQARKEVVSTLANGISAALLPAVGTALRDSSEEVAAIAARTIAKSDLTGSASLLAARLGELDVDNVDFTRARELIAALAITPEPAAGDALRQLAARRALIKRGRFAEVQVAVAQALASRLEGGLD